MSFKGADGRETHKQIYLPTGNRRLKCYDWCRKLLWSTNENHLKTCDNVRKTGTGEDDDYTTGCLLDFPYFRKHYKLIAADLSKQQKLDTHLKTIQQINFAENLDRAEGSTIFLIIEEAKEAVLEFSEEAVKVLWFYFCFNIILI